MKEINQTQVSEISGGTSVGDLLNRGYINPGDLGGTPPFNPNGPTGSPDLPLEPNPL